MVDFIVNNQPMVECKVDYSTPVILQLKMKNSTLNKKVLVRDKNANMGLKPIKIVHCAVSSKLASR